MGKSKYNLQNIQEIAANRGGKCLSKEYINLNTKYEWKCKKHHTWKATGYHIKEGHWCPKCAAEERGLKRRLSIEDMKKIAMNWGGKCLSIKYKNNRMKLLWQCNEGHIWKARVSHIRNGT